METRLIPPHRLGRIRKPQPKSRDRYLTDQFEKHILVEPLDLPQTFPDCRNIREPLFIGSPPLTKSLMDPVVRDLCDGKGDAMRGRSRDSRHGDANEGTVADLPVLSTAQPLSVGLEEMRPANKTCPPAMTTWDTVTELSLRRQGTFYQNGKEQP